MRFGAYVMFMLCIGISLWFLGIPTGITYVLGIQPAAGLAYAPTGDAVYGGKPLDLTTFVQRIGQVFTSTNGIAALIGIGTLLAVSSLTGFSSMYFIPAVLLIFITNFLALPISTDILGTHCTDAGVSSTCTQSAGIPPFIYYPILILFNVLTIMACISFIRGGV